MYSVSVEERGEAMGESKSDALSLFDAPGRKARSTSTVRDTRRGNMAVRRAPVCSTRCAGMGGRSMPSSSCDGEVRSEDQQEVESDVAESESRSRSVVPANAPAAERLERVVRERGGRRFVEDARARRGLGRGGGLRRGGGGEADGMGIFEGKSQGGRQDRLIFILSLFARPIPNHAHVSHTFPFRQPLSPPCRIRTALLPLFARRFSPQPSLQWKRTAQSIGLHTAHCPRCWGGAPALRDSS